MLSNSFSLRVLITLFPALLSSAVAFGKDGDDHLRLTYISASSQKMEQVIGDRDWQSAFNGILRNTASQTVTRADVLGTDHGVSFEHNGSLVFLFGDTIGAAAEYFPTWVDFTSDYRWQAHDPIAWSDTRRADDPLVINFLKDSLGNPLYVNPIYPDGYVLPMNADDVPNAGISLNGHIYIIVNAGADVTDKTDAHAHAYSVLTTFDPISQSFAAGRTISRTDQGGHFVFDTLHEYSRECGADEDSVLMFGEGDFRKSDIYLSMTPKNGFTDGVGTKYFAGCDHGHPIWKNHEIDAKPVVVDNPRGSIPPDHPGVGELTVTYCHELGLWLMTYDGGRVTPEDTGAYFTYAKHPWGPWSTPQLIFNASRDNGLGNFIRAYDATSGVGAGPEGPTINLQNNPPATTPGGDFGPHIIERFTKVEGNMLTIYYLMATWNPYTVIKMKSEFRINHSDDH